MAQATIDNYIPRYELVNTAHYTKDDEEEWWQDYSNNKEDLIDFDQHERDLLRHIVWDENAREYHWLEEGRRPRVRVNLNTVPLLRQEVVTQQNTQGNSAVASKKRKRKSRKSTRSKTKKRKYHKKRKSRKPRHSRRKQRRSKTNKKK